MIDLILNVRIINKGSINQRHLELYRAPQKSWSLKKCVYFCYVSSLKQNFSYHLKEQNSEIFLYASDLLKLYRRRQFYLEYINPTFYDTSNDIYSVAMSFLSEFWMLLHHWCHLNFYRGVINVISNVFSRNWYTKEWLLAIHDLYMISTHWGRRSLLFSKNYKRSSLQKCSNRFTI